MPKSTQVTVPTLSEVSTVYSALLDKKVEFGRLNASLEAEANVLREGMLNWRPKADHDRKVRIGSLLGDDITEIVDQPTRLQEIEIQLGDIRTAKAELETRLTAARTSASKTISDGLRGVYAERVAGVARGLIAAHNAHRELLELTNELGAKDVAWTGHLPPMQAFRILGDVRDNQSFVARYLAESASLGFIKASEIPGELL